MRGSVRCALGVALASRLAACGAEEEPRPSSAPPLAMTGEQQEGPNRAPSVSKVRISPAHPVAGIPLQAVVEASDPDGDPVQLRYSWVRNGRKLGRGAAVLRLDDARKGERIEVEVVASDGEFDSRPVRDGVELENRPPELLGIALDPSQVARPGSEIRAHPHARDPDGDPLGFTYAWFVNGRRRGAGESAFSVEGLQRGDEVSVEIVAKDGEDASPSMRSAPVIVGNAPPVITSTPPVANRLETFEYAVEARDPDGDRNLRFTLLEGPEGMRLDPVTGKLEWTPLDTQTGRFAVDVAVADELGASSAQRFELTVAREPADAAPADQEGL